MKYIILLTLAMLSYTLSMLVLLIAVDTVGSQGLLDIIQSSGEQSQFYISTIVVFIISTIAIGIMWHKAEVLISKY